ncbi:MAG TPA: SUMF1/EgtB/PvdO family nonheme iron enzyme, partial [Candidatus Cloacimonadota bacterium]|nr:SUMF1/EgtB/PvdO family nonheme iron enzyme [Candidatus Cloacimonadota bacterium]
IIDKKVGADDWQIGYGSVGENIETWTDTSAEINTLIFYRVCAFYYNYNSDYTSIVGINNTFPAPEDLTAAIEYLSTGLYDIHLSWTYPIPGLEGYRIVKNGTLLSEIIPVGTNEWTDHNLNMCEELSYQVFAYYQNYNSSYSNLVTLTTPNPFSGMVLIEGSCFIMGDHYNEGNSNELPLHYVTLSNFWISEHEITQSEYETVVGSNPSNFLGDNNPVERTTWFDAATYCNLRSQQEGYTPCYDLSDWSCDFTANGYRLPTEAEWEYVARGGSDWQDDYKYSGTSDNLGDFAWYYNNSGSSSQSVCTKFPNQIYIFDMSGNVNEWCNDWYDSDYYSSSPTNDPNGPESGTYRVVRGGGWYSGDSDCRVAFRAHNLPATFSNKLGFRVVKSE